jgi:hypothetical protein
MHFTDKVCHMHIKLLLFGMYKMVNLPDNIVNVCIILGFREVSKRQFLMMCGNVD